MTVRDEFFWLGEINKATLVINSRQGLLPMPIAEEAAKALREVLADGDADPTKRAKTYITFEPLMLKKKKKSRSRDHADARRPFQPGYARNLSFCHSSRPCSRSR
ncbi:hypothetical protein [Parasutterella excrementihominis]|uniref:hypothetical protein n=1 Tax=Parasutterella excrementihominis TaxID=487175 RepID=UPI0024311562|nr:hypothetical protein [Parasutterella excrementihominis]